MGAKQSAPVPQDALINACVTTVNTFGPVFLKAVAVESLEAAGVAAPAKEPALALQLPPTATEPLLQGWLDKLGEKGGWKRRYFVVTEEAENFVVFYFASPSDCEARHKARGFILPCGYAVSETVPAQAATAPPGGHCFSLAPLHDAPRRRIYTLRCETQEQLEHWKLVLRFAARRCQPQLSADRVLASAFRQAYERTRRHLGLKGSSSIDRAEPEQLAVLCSQACEESLHKRDWSGGEGADGAAHATGPGVSEVGSTIEALQADVDRVAHDVVASSWPALCARVALRKDFIDRQVIASLAALQTERSARIADVRARLGPIFVDAAADEETRAKIAVVLGALLRPQYKSHKAAAKILFSRISEIIDRGLKEGELRSFYRDVRWQEAALLPALRKIWALTRGNNVDEHEAEASLRLLSELTVPLPQLIEMLQGGGLTLQDVESRCEDEIRMLVGRGIFSFVARIEVARGSAAPLACLHDVMRDFIHDSKVRQRNCVVAITITAVVIPDLRSRALSIAAITDLLSSSAVQTRDFETIPGLASRPSGGAPPPSDSSGGGSSPAAVAVPQASPVRVNKKARFEAEEALRARPVGAVFTDADWLVDVALRDAAEELVATVGDARITAMLARMDKLLAKLVWE